MGNGNQPGAVPARDVIVCTRHKPDESSVFHNHDSSVARGGGLPGCLADDGNSARVFVDDCRDPAFFRADLPVVTKDEAQGKFQPDLNYSGRAPT